jgi:hypothetical protein
MPKIEGTRKQLAGELIKMVTNGPSFSGSSINGNTLTTEEATKQYRRWADSWVIEKIERLVPELRKKD